MQAATRFYIDGERMNSRDISSLTDFTDVQVFHATIGGGEEGEGGGEEPITIKVRDQSGEEMIFRVKRSTQMKKIFDAYASRLGVRAESLKFTFDGESVKEDHTPKMLELTDNDQIDVFLHQTGGSETADAKSDSEVAITIKVRDTGTGEEIAFKVKKLTKMSKIMEAYTKRKGIASSSVRFLVDDKRVGADDTPKLLELEDGDEVQVVSEQQGGAL
jgi:small ubiquitin-related modifier